MSKIEELESFPDVSMIGERSLGQVLTELINDYETEYQRLTGERITLAPADPVRLALQATALLLYQILQKTEYAARQNYLRYAEGEALDHLAAFKGCIRRTAQAAETVLRFTIFPQSMATVIPAGTRAATADGVMFMTTQYAEIGPEQSCVEVPARAEQVGESSNGYPAGAVSVAVDPLPYLTSVENIAETAGGTDRESDDALTARVYAAPGAYSVAGPIGAYAYHARRFRADIEDVKVFSAVPTQVTVMFMLTDGKLPGKSDLKAMEEWLSAATLRPLCDFVTAAAPEEQGYEIDLTYYIRKSDHARAVAIQNDVARAVERYKKWQRTMERDINPSELTRNIMEAGAKRVTVRKPLFASTPQGRIARLEKETICYGGLEDD